jgi:hypothetical protein
LKDVACTDQSNLSRTNGAPPFSLVDETDEFDSEIRARLVEAAENDFNVSTAKRISRQLRHIAGLVGLDSVPVRGQE